MQYHLAHKTQVINVQRFGSGESATSQTGISRLDQYLKRLNGQINDENNHQSTKKTKKRKSKRNREPNGHHAPPLKKVRFAVDEPIASKAKKIELCIEENLNSQTIDRIMSSSDDDDSEESSQSSEENDHKMKEKNKKKKKEKTHHPIYDITTFPKIKLPKVINPEKTLMPEPIWMKKGNKIIADISDKNESEQYTKDHSLNSLRLDSRLIDILKNEGYEKYFPVQRNVIPAVIRGMVQKRDIAVCAPTGSGKTLAFILPICHVLCKELSENTHRLRALIVSPSRDLAFQLYCEFKKFGECVGLKIGLSAAQKSMRDEQAMICDERTERTIVDVLVCTPGRLVDHLNHTIGFKLNKLQFLVLDEADRLLAESSQDWLFRLYHVLETQRLIEQSKHESAQKDRFTLPRIDGKICLTSRKSSAYEYKPYLLKMLFSATLTHNPKIISSLKLNNPLYFGSLTEKQYLIPSSIEQYFLCIYAGDKLNNFISLIDILHQQKQSAVCFCNTVDIAHRLKRIIEIVWNVVHKQPLNVAEFSRMVSDRERPRILQKFKSGKIDFLICSDAMSRGLDVPSLDCVINFECPKNVERYVHRIGRTARGVGKGTAYTLLMKKEKKTMIQMLESVENGDKLQEFKMKMKTVRFHRKYIDKYTKILNDVLIKENDGELDHNEAIDQKLLE